MSSSNAASNTDVSFDEKNNTHLHSGVNSDLDYVVTDKETIGESNYSLNLITPRGNVSPTSQYVARVLDNHPDSYQPDMNISEKVQKKNALIDKGIITEDEDINPEIPDEMLEYVQAVAISEHVDDVNLKDMGVYLDDKEPRDYSKKGEWFDDYGHDIIRVIKNADKTGIRSRDIAEEIEASAKQIGTGLGKIQERVGTDFIIGRHNGTTYDVEKMQSELDLDALEKEGLDAL